MMMKKMRTLFVLALAVSCIFLAAGCSGGSGGNSGSGNSGTSGSTGTTSGSGSGTQTEIGLDEAERIALEDAGVAEADAVYVTAHPEYDDGAYIYNVEFYSGNTEYDYEIDAYTGEIRSFDQDIEDYTIGSTPSQSGGNGAQIDVEAAKEAAFSQAGVTEDAVTLTKAELEYDDGRAMYQIEYIYNDMEYEFEIDAADGSVIQQEKESFHS